MRDQLRSHRKAALAAAAAAGGDEALAKPWPPQAQAKAAEPVAARHLVAGAAGSGKPAAARLAERLALKFRAREALHRSIMQIALRALSERSEAAPASKPGLRALLGA